MAKGSQLKSLGYCIRKCLNFLLAKGAENILIISHGEMQYIESNQLKTKKNPPWQFYNYMHIQKFI